MADAANENKRSDGFVKQFASAGLVATSKLSMVFLGAVLAFSMVSLINEYELLSSLFTITDGYVVKLHVPTELDPQHQRDLSLNLGNGNCLWQPPQYDVPDDIDFYKTAVVGYPSGDKRMVFIQMESLTGWPAKDEWDFEYLGDSNHPFIKANYPHHEGIWGWGSNADQVVLVVKNIRRSLVEYHDILWDIGYAQTWADARANMDKIYGERPPMEDFQEWRDIRVLDEISWYGWFIDWWMEEGLYRDVFTHKITTPEHYAMLMQPHNFKREEVDYDVVVGADTVVTPTYDPHCTNGDISNGCMPVQVVSAEKLLDYDEGPAETTAIANTLVGNEKMSQFVIDPEAWNCIWDELIMKKKGARTIVSRDNTQYTEMDYNFSADMLEAMIAELDRLITKYGSSDWNTLPTANRLVELFTEHRALIQQELDEVNSGTRQLNNRDFLGPKEREKRRVRSGNTETKQPNIEYFQERDRERKILRLARAAKNSIGRLKWSKTAAQE